MSPEARPKQLTATARRLATVAVAVAGVALVAPRAARADALEDALRGLAGPGEDAIEASVRRLAELDDPRAIPALNALCDGSLKAGPDGRPYIYDSKLRELLDVLTVKPVSPAPQPTREVEVSNTIRRVALPVLAQLQLGSPSASVRLAAAEELANRGTPEAAALLRRALERERDSSVHDALALALAGLELGDADAAVRRRALAVIERVGNNNSISDLQRIEKSDPDADTRAAAKGALAAVLNRQRMISAAGDFLHGLSLASVLLFAALGLAVTFGLLGVINMAHGEMLMIGAYSTYAVQTIFAAHAPGMLQAYLLVAIPVAFVVTAGIGVLLERLVIRHLYGRPLETLLATWGISLLLIQTVRLIFGAQNVTVANPSWLAGGVTLAHGLVLPWSRIAVVGFVIVVAAAVWFLLQRTSLGLQVRAVTQNRGMAACLGIRTSRVDAWMFGLGSGIAGLGGVALSQLGNVGPELGQGYIIDSFLVVVLGGVGRLAGAVAAALGLGIVNKILEPLTGAVAGKIAVLMFIILFIQRRPQGLFAPKGRIEA